MDSQKRPRPDRLLVRDWNGKSVTVRLDTDSYILGRSPTCELSYPKNTFLSRQHLAISKHDGVWKVEDLGSLNGSSLNGRKLSQPTELQAGDCIEAGQLIIEVAGEDSTVEDPDHLVTFVEVPRLPDPATETSLGEVDKTPNLRSTRHTQVLIRAGRALALHRPLEELFDVILDLAMEAVSAQRGVLMTLEKNNQLKARALRGRELAISRTVRDRVLQNRSSLLVGDTWQDPSLVQQKSIREQNIRSLIAVPLQTTDRVTGLLYVDLQDLVRGFNREDLELLTVLANVAAIRIEHARLVEVEIAERAAAMELDQAAAIQRGLLPARAPQINGVEIAGTTLACHTVGGDYFDYLVFPDGRFAVIVGDVAGKGMPAALLVSTVQAHVKALFDTGDQLVQKITRINKAACAAFPDNRFVTLFVTVMDPASGLLTYTNAGHNPPLLSRAGVCEELSEGGMALGLFQGAIYEEANTAMRAGDALVIYSDGVTEAMNAAGEIFGEDRLAQIVTLRRNESATEIMNAIHAEVLRFTAPSPVTDDITIVVVRKT